MKRFEKFIATGLAMVILFLTSCTGTDPKISESSITVTEITREEAEDKPFTSTFFGDDVLRNIQTNCEKFPEFKEKRQEIVEAAEKFMEMTYDELWELVFDPNLERSWMVLSDGICPACRKPVVMYDWIIDPFKHPWKLMCPHCEELFPKNDFYAFYRSGLDEKGRFSYDRADKSLLFNEETGNKDDKFGVDDGRGFKQGDRIFRFIATYLVYGQWKKTILEGINTLSEAYIYTQNPEYGIRALILLDRLADFWPEYDYYKQGWLYERIQYSAGYISYRIDAAFEAYDMAVAYDKVKELLFKEPKICEFLSEKALRTENKNPKKTPEDVKRNIDERILRDFIKNPAKLQCNVPYTDVAIIVASAVLDWPDNRGVIASRIQSIITDNTKYDGMTGESGLMGYAAMGKSAIAKLCNLFVYTDPDFIKTMYNRSKALYQAYRFHIDLYCVDKYYPILGDTSYFGLDGGTYPNSGGLENLMLYELYEETGDEDLLRVIYQANGNKTEGAFLWFPGLPDIDKRCETIDRVIKEKSVVTLESVKKEKYQIAVLRTGVGKDRTEVWINYGTNKISHDHKDGMNIGIYYKDADLMPDNGYPNVAYGDGWNSPVVAWAYNSMAHNVISFNNQSHSRTFGRITLWSIGDTFKVLRANASGTFPNVKRYERSLCLIDITDQNAYVVDVFRVGNGPAGTYERFNRGNIGKMEVKGLRFLDVQKSYPSGVYMKNFKRSIQTDAVWEADWATEDYFDVIEYGEDMHLRLLDLTRGETVYICDTWLPPSYEMSTDGHQGFQLPTVITSKTVREGETTAFVSVLEPYSKEPLITNVKRLSCMLLSDGKDPDTNIAISVENATGTTDVIILVDPETVSSDSVKVTADKGEITTDAQACFVRYDKEGNLKMIRASKGSFVKINDREYSIKNSEEPTIIDFP